MKAVSDVIMNKIIQRLRSAARLPTETHTIETREELNTILGSLLNKMQSGSTCTVYIKDPNAILGVGTKDYTITVYKSDHNPLPEFYDSTNMSVMLIDGWFALHILTGVSYGSSGWQFTGPYKLLDAGTVKDYVTDEGVKEGWTYRNWKSGKFEAWYRYLETVEESTEIGEGPVQYSYKCPLSIPFEAKEIRHIQATSRTSSISVRSVVREIIDGEIDTCFYAAGSSQAPVRVEADIYVMGIL